MGEEHFVQIVPENKANFKAAGKMLENKMPHLFWTPCARKRLHGRRKLLKLSRYVEALPDLFIIMHGF